MRRNQWFDCIFIICLFQSSQSVILTNLCPSSTSCNCTLVNSTDLSIICDTSVLLTDLPTLVPTSYQNNVIRLQVSSSISSNRGPFISLPTNLCNYPNIQQLDFSFNRINESFNMSDLFCTNTQLQTIDFSNNFLTSMPAIDTETFVSFPKTITLMDFSSNQITEIDLWPLFTRTGSSMTIDMSNNRISDYTNIVPISVASFTTPPDPRYFNLDNNDLTYLSDLLLEQYGACSTNGTSRNYFIVAISNLLLTNNPLVCDCQSYQLISYIQDWIVSFPDLYEGDALLNQAVCAQPVTVPLQSYLSASFADYNYCENYTLPSITDIFCSLTANDTRVTLVPPTYWTTTTTARPSANGNSNQSRSTSIASSWYIILGVVLGIAAVLAVIIAIAYRLRSKFFVPNLTDPNNPKKSYEQIKGNTERLSEKNFKLNSMNGIDEHQRNNGKHHQLGQETQTNLPFIRDKPPSGRLTLSARRSRPREGSDEQGSKLSLPLAADAATNTVNVVKGIPIPSAGAPKPPMAPAAAAGGGGDGVVPPVANNTETNPTGVDITPIAVRPSKRAKVLPPVKSGVYDESKNENLLNTSAGALVTSQRQRRRSLTWLRKQNSNNFISPLPPRPNSMVTQKTNFDYDGSFDEDIPSIPTTDILSEKPSKSLRTVPLLNISVVPAWIGNDDDDD